jgi:hypothetical protein
MVNRCLPDVVSEGLKLLATMEATEIARYFLSYGIVIGARRRFDNAKLSDDGATA